MKVRFWAAGLVVLGLVACGGEEPANEAGGAGSSEKLSVVVSGGVPCDLTKQVAGDSLEVTCLMEPGQDPHSYTLTAGDRRKLETADLIVYSGLGLEEELGKAFTSAKVEAIPVFEKAVPDPLFADSDPHAGHDHGHSNGDHDGHDDHDHGHGDEKHDDHKGHDHDDHGHDPHGDHDHDEEHGDEKHGDEEHGDHGAEGKFVDPHVWHDATLGAASVKVIAESLGGLNPEAAAEYEERAEAIAAELTELDGWIKTQIETVPKESRQLVTVHDAFRYYATAYGLEVPGTVGNANHDSKPSAQDLAELVDRVKALKIPTIFAETTSDSSTLETVARSAGIKLAETALFVDGPGGDESEATSYQEMLVTNTCAIAEGLGGTCGTSPLE